MDLLRAYPRGDPRGRDLKQLVWDGYGNKLIWTQIEIPMHQYRAVCSISSAHYSPSKPSQNGCYCSEHPLSSDGVSTSLKPTQRVSRHLSVRYDGCAKITLHQLATGLACMKVVKAFPVPGCLAGCQPVQIKTARLAGITATHKGNCPTISGVNSIALMCSPDLPSNGSSLRDLDCTHSNYQT